MDDMVIKRIRVIYTLTKRILISDDDHNNN